MKDVACAENQIADPSILLAFPMEEVYKNK